MAMSADQTKKLSDSRLMAKIAEEASEVTKAVMKHFAHGARPTFEGVQYDNVADTLEEFRQLTRFVKEYRDRFITPAHREANRTLLSKTMRT